MNVVKRACTRLARFLVLFLISVRPLFAADSVAAAKPDAAGADEPSLAAWKAACDRLPSNRSLHGNLAPRELLPLPKFSNFDIALTAFIERSKTGALAQASNWIGGRVPSDGFLDSTRAYFSKAISPLKSAIPFQPFAQKLDVPSGSEIFYHADFHGDIHSLLRDLTWLNTHGYLSGFKAARPNFYMIFLGDYTDRGAFGIEVLYTLFRLKTANPDQVFLARGNHEEISLQSRYGFAQEARAKYGSAFDFEKMFRAYDFLPVVIYAGSGGNYIQCNHGGMEPGFSPGKLLGGSTPLSFQLIGNLYQQQFLAAHQGWITDPDSSDRASKVLRDFKPEDPINPSTLGFMWNDFSLLASEAQFEIDPGRAFVFGQGTTGYLLEAAGTAGQKVQAVFRGHQQSPTLNPMMRRLVASHGVFRHWQANDSSALRNAAISALEKVLEHDEIRPIPPGSVWTFNVSPDSYYGEGCGYTFDSFGILKTATAFPEWRLQVVNVPVVP
ncbi:MAG: hypothetical protein JWM99_4867 [Verrucomicrobiales bacterium]|jgi:hypothetical protein|nr:hypothetical protein [Verrucomicrobiales bacterium]